MSLLSVIAASRRRFDADAADYFARIVAAGSSISAANQLAVDAFVRGCKADGIWTSIKASCLLAGPDNLTGALVPLVGPAPTNGGGNFVAGDYNRTTGLKGNGTTKYLDTNHAANAQTADNCHIAYYSTGTGQDNNPKIGTYSSSLFQNRIANNFRLRQTAAQAAVTMFGLPGAGFIGASRAGSTGYTARAASVSTFFERASNGDGRGSTWGVFAYQDGLTPTADRISFYSIGESLTLSLLDARLATYMAALT
jgi:hypothetical protein